MIFAAKSGESHRTYIRAVTVIDATIELAHVLNLPTPIEFYVK